MSASTFRVKSGPAGPVAATPKLAVTPISPARVANGAARMSSRTFSATNTPDLKSVSGSTNRNSSPP